jgi:hypothetical protein
MQGLHNHFCGHPWAWRYLGLRRRRALQKDDHHQNVRKNYFNFGFKCFLLILYFNL